MQPDFHHGLLTPETHPAPDRSLLRGRATHTHHEVHLLAAFTPVEQLALAAGGSVGEMRADGRFDEAPAKLPIRPCLLGRKPGLSRHQGRV